MENDKISPLGVEIMEFEAEFDQPSRLESVRALIGRIGVRMAEFLDASTEGGRLMQNNPVVIHEQNQRRAAHGMPIRTDSEPC